MVAAVGSNGNGVPTATVNSISIIVTYTASALSPPTVGKSFSPTAVAVSTSSTLTVTLNNPNASAITGATLSDPYPAGLVNASAPAGTTTCAGGTVSATAGASSVSLSGGTIPVNGSCTVTVSVTSSTAGSYANNVTIGAVTSNNAPANVVASNSATLNVNPSVASFDAVEVGAAPRTNLYTQLSGVAFSVDILALDSSNLVSNGYTGTVSLTLVDASSSGTCGSMTSLQSLGNQTFTSGNAGRTTVSITYVNAARNVKIRINDATLGITSCSFDAFAIRPNSFATITSNMTNTATTGTPAVTAGGNFTLTATAIAGYNGTPSIDSIKIAAHTGATQTGTVAGVFSAATPAAGVATGATFTYSEVGNFQFLAQGVYDDTFTAVDQPSDCTNNFSNTLTGGKYGCKFANSTATSFFGRFLPANFMVSSVSLTNRSGLACASTFTYMGEGIAFGFTLTAKNAAGATAQNYTTASGFAQLNPAAPRYFNFVAKDSIQTSLRSYSISAVTRASPGQVTTLTAHGFVTGQQVYIAGVNGMTQINGQLVSVTVVNSTNFTIGVDTTGYGIYTAGGTVSRLAGLTSSGSWIAGAASVNATVTLQRAVNPDGPYTALTIGIAPRDDDGIALFAGLLNFDADNNGVNDSFNVGATETRFGRLRLGNAFGTSLLDLPLPLSAEYYNGNFFVTNAQDSCTSLAASDFAFVFIGGTNLAACNTAMSPSGTITFSVGIGSAKLTKPGSANNGSVDLTINLNGASGNTCTAVGGLGPAATNANKQYLQGNWGSGSYTDNPRGRATFGIYKNSDSIIYLREIY